MPQSRPLTNPGQLFLFGTQKIKEGKMSKTSDDAGKVWPRILSIILGIIVVWGGVTLFVFPMFVSKVEKRGQWGDSFGMINALFAGLAFAGVIWAIILQKKELALQREELANTRKEIKGQKEQLEAQNQTLQKQNFDSSFFQLLGLHNDIVNSMKTSMGFYSGRQCFGELLNIGLTHAELKKGAIP